LWFRKYAQDSDKCFVSVESISNAGMHESPGTVQPTGMPGGKTEEKRELCGASEKELEAPRLWQSFSFVSSGVMKGKGATHMEWHESVQWLMDGWEDIVVDIYSCHRG